MKLVDDVKEWKRWWSMRFAILTAVLMAVQIAWPTLPHEWTSDLPDWFKNGLAVVSLSSAAMTAISRVIKQKPKE